jgi:glucose-6-phosphate isomerase
MNTLKLNLERSFGTVSKEEIDALKGAAEKANQQLHDQSGKGNDFLGWVNLPSEISSEFVADVQAKAEELKSKIDILVVIGIGGSYLGAKAVIDALANGFSHLQKDRKAPLVIFAGQNIGEDYMVELRTMLKDYEWAINVISKSGTTTEPAIAFRILKQDLEDRYGKEEAVSRIVAVTDEAKGALRQLTDQEGYKSYVIPDNVGGRFSVLTPVGLLSIAVAGFDIAALVKGAKDMQTATAEDVAYEDKIACQYAEDRNALYQKGKTVEILVNYQPKLQYFAEWWKQLYGESEGKEGKGIFPASVNFSSDLHSMGQYIQEGERILFETVISVKDQQYSLNIPSDKANLDGLNYISGKSIDHVNKMAELGTMIAHVDGGVPNLQLEVPKLDEYTIGQLIYFFEKACGISGYILDVNPFDQPGVEAYKKNMFALLGKPGFEEATKEIKARL